MMRVWLRVSTTGRMMGLAVGLGLLLTGCYQTAGSSVVPTVAELTATNAPPLLPTIDTVAGQGTISATPTTLPGVPTLPPAITDTPAITMLPNQPTVTAASVIFVSATPASLPPTQAGTVPAAGQAGASPSDTPFITAISTQGFLTPTSAGIGLTNITPAVVGTSAINPTGAALVLNTPTALPTEGACIHTVQPGDHVYSIARQYKVSVDDLLAANPALQNNPDKLQIGQTLTIPHCVLPTMTPGALPVINPTAAIVVTVAGPTVPGPTTYSVISGDTLLAIARKFNTTVAKLEQANGLNDQSILHIGQSLIIPPS